MRRSLLVLTVAAVVATACTQADPGAKEIVRRPAAETTTTTTTLADNATVTTVPGLASPLTGLPVQSPDLVDRRVLAVKVDNHPMARPQSGIQDAEAMVEVLVEGGFTRFIALFHAADSDYVGPIRSLRPNDPQIVSALGATLVISGGQPWIQAIAAAHEVGLVGEGAGTFRIPQRPGPHDLYGSTAELRAVADQRDHPDDPPQPWLPIGEWELPEAAATAIAITWSIGDVAEWRYHPVDGVYRRWSNGVAQEWIDRDGDRGHIEADTLVVLGASFYIASPPPGVDGTPVPAVDTVGSGPAWVFAHGRVWQGTWVREDPSEPFVLLDADGLPVTIPAGRPWISFPPEAQPVDYS